VAEIGKAADIAEGAVAGVAVIKAELLSRRDEQRARVTRASLLPQYAWETSPAGLVHRSTSRSSPEKLLWPPAAGQSADECSRSAAVFPERNARV
jgi:hypothetical protein